MSKFVKSCVLIVLLLVALPNQFFVAKAASFNKKINEIQKEINRDNVKEATRLLKKVKISSETEQDRINLLFGDIYVKINQPGKAIEFYEKSYMTTNEKVESLANLGLAEAHLQQGKLIKAINYVEQSLLVDEDSTRAKIVLATAKNRNGDHEEALQILDDLYFNHKDNAEINLAIANYYASFDKNKKAIDILEKFLKRSPDNIKVMNQLANLYWLTGDNEKAIALKYKIYKHYVYTGNRYLAKKTKIWIISVEPDYFTKKNKPKTISRERSDKYEKNETENYNKKKIVPHYEEFDFAYNASGSGFIIGNGKFVLTNKHVIAKTNKIAVRNGIGKVSNASVYRVSKNYDLAILKLEKPFSKEFSIPGKDFDDPIEGMDVISIGYPMGRQFGIEHPTITQGIVSKVYDDSLGVFITTVAINPGNSGGPIFNLDGNLIGVSVQFIDKMKILKKHGFIPTSMGVGIKSKMLRDIFDYKKTIPVKKAKFNKSELYQKMLPKVVFVAVRVESKYLQKKN